MAFGMAFLESVSAVGVFNCTPTDWKRWWHDTKEGQRTKEIRPIVLIIMNIMNEDFSVW